MSAGLDSIGKIADGTNYSFAHLNCPNKGLTQLYDVMEGYPHLRMINLSENKLTDVNTLTKIKYLRQLNLSKNEIANLQTFNHKGTLEFLEELNLSGNKITVLEPITVINLKHLNLNENQIATAEHFQGHPNLTVLEMRKNKLKNLKGVTHMPRILEL